MQEQLVAREAKASKGEAFERLFADHMVKSLGFSETQLRQLLRGKTATRPYEVDIVGTKKQPFWKIVYIISAVVMCAGILTLFSPTTCSSVSDTMNAAGRRVQKAAGLSSVGAGIVVIGIIAFVAGTVGDRSSRRRVWVECKDRKSRIKRVDITKTVASVEDVRAHAGSKRAEMIDAVWYASTVEYDVDAVNLAREKGVVLFLAVQRPEGTLFEQV